MPGSPRYDEPTEPADSKRPLHPAALLVACLFLGAGVSLARAPLWIALFTLGAMTLALRAEGRPLRGEAPLVGLAAIVFAAHLLLGGRPPAEAAPASAAIALRLLGLVYLTRWAARGFLPRTARWLFARRGPRGPRWLVRAFESARLTVALLPTAFREAEQQHLAVRARALRAGGGAGPRARYLAAWLLPFLGTMLRVGDAYGDALFARGYAAGAPRRSGLALSWGAAEAGVLLASAAAAAWIAYAR
ncbi:MAG: hypothetical protein ACM3JJ_03085 [Hyphomicrobiales bacterium]